MKPSERKARTKALLEKRGIPYFRGLPCIESEDETELRTPEEVGIRMFCLYCVIGASHDRFDTSYQQYLKRHGLWNHLTPAELSFLSNVTADRQSAKEFTWRSEALFLLMWAVRLIETLPLPSHQTDNQQIISIFPGLKKPPWPFINGLELRPKSEILNAADLLYRLHWATRQADINGQPSPAGLDPEVVYEWHYAINWITKYRELDWDNVTTDT